MLGWWANAWSCLKHSAAPIPRPWLPYPCFKNPPQRDKLADSGLFSPRFFLQSSYPRYWDPSAWPLVPRAVHFSITSGFFSKKKTCFCLTLFSEFLPHSICRIWSMWICCNCHTGHKKVTDLLCQPMSRFYCSISFSMPSNPSSSHLSLKTAGRNIHKCFYKQIQIRLKCNCATTVTCLSIFQCLCLDVICDTWLRYTLLHWFSMSALYWSHA